LGSPLLAVSLPPLLAVSLPPPVPVPLPLSADLGSATEVGLTLQKKKKAHHINSHFQTNNEK
jgi:hypothetical protein